MKEDILKQLIEDWLVEKEGWFVKHNVKFRLDGGHSDIDLVALSKTGAVAVVSCKSWQGWELFQERCSDKWIKAFVDKIFQETGKRRFTYYIAVPRAQAKEGDKIALEKSPVIQERFNKHKAKITLKVITIKDVLNQYAVRVENKDTKALEGTDIGRLLQLIHAAGMRIQ